MTFLLFLFFYLDSSAFLILDLIWISRGPENWDSIDLHVFWFLSFLPSGCREIFDLDSSKSDRRMKSWGPGWLWVPPRGGFNQGFNLLFTPPVLKTTASDLLWFWSPALNEAIGNPWQKNLSFHLSSLRVRCSIIISQLHYESSLVSKSMTWNRGGEILRGN